MRFVHGRNSIRNHTIRTRTAYLWFPMTIYDPTRDAYELRWLERTTWEEQYCAVRSYWVPTRWL